MSSWSVCRVVACLISVRFDNVKFIKNFVQAFNSAITIRKKMFTLALDIVVVVVGFVLV